MRPMTTQHLEQWWAKIDKVSSPNGCWLWTAYCAADGYGNYRHQYAHRVSWEIANGVIPPNMQVLHKDARICPRNCVNPEHLYLGTPIDNVADCLHQGRHARLLTDEQVDQIVRELETETPAVVGERWKLPRALVYKIRKGWRYATHGAKQDGVARVGGLVRFRPDLD